MKTGARAALAALVATFLAGGAAEAADPKLSRKDDLRAEPSAAAAVVASLDAGAPVKLMTRKGFWQQVQAGSVTGWVKLSSVDVGDGGSAVEGLAALATGRGATGNVVAASGTRGLSAEDLTGARPDPAELARLLAIDVKPQAAAAFAAEAGLKPRDIPYIVPVSTASSRKAGERTPK